MRISFSKTLKLSAPVVAGALLALVAVSGCGKKKPEQAAPVASASAEPASDLKAFIADEAAPLTKEIYRALVLDLATCKVSDRGIDPKCPAYGNLRQSRNRKTSLKDMQAMNAEIGKELIGHEHPAVRLQAAKLMQSVFGSNPNVQKAIVEAAKKEKVPAVLAAMLRTVGSKHKTSEDIKKLLLEMSDHASPIVRREAMSWFLTSFGEGVPGTFDKVLEKVDNDPDEDVRAYLCNRLYGSSDERALAVFKKYLEAPDAPKKVYNACWNGVINSWTGFPKPHKPSKEGYELTMKVLEATPRTKDRPSWSGISTLRSAKTDYKDSDRFGTAWLEQVKDWYKKDRLVKALKTIATDTEANWMARTAALRVMQELDEPKATFTALATKYASATTGDDMHVKRQLDDILRKFDAPAAGSGAPPRPPRPGMGPGGPGGPGHGGPGRGGPGAPPPPPPGDAE